MDETPLSCRINIPMFKLLKGGNITCPANNFKTTGGIKIKLGI